jgi:hypothetical protein
MIEEKRNDRREAVRLELERRRLDYERRVWDAVLAQVTDFEMSEKMWRALRADSANLRYSMYSVYSVYSVCVCVRAFFAVACSLFLSVDVFVVFSVVCKFFAVAWSLFLSVDVIV